MDENATNYRYDGSDIVVVEDMEVIPGRNMGCKGGLSKKVERESGL